MQLTFLGPSLSVAESAAAASHVARSGEVGRRSIITTTAERPLPVLLCSRRRSLDFALQFHSKPRSGILPPVHHASCFRPLWPACHCPAVLRSSHRRRPRLEDLRCSRPGRQGSRGPVRCRWHLCHCSGMQFYPSVFAFGLSLCGLSVCRLGNSFPSPLIRFRKKNKKDQEKTGKRKHRVE